MSKLFDELLRTADTRSEAMAIISHIKDADILHEDLATVKVYIDGILLEKLLFGFVIRDSDGNYAINTDCFSSPNFLGLNSERYKIHVETGETEWVGGSTTDSPSASYPNKHYRYLEEVDFTKFQIMRKLTSGWEQIDLADYLIFDDEEVVHARNIAAIDPERPSAINISWTTDADSIGFSNEEPPTDVLRAVNCLMIFYLMVISPTYASLFQEIAENGVDFEANRHYVNESVLQCNVIHYHTSDWSNADIMPFFSTCCILSLTTSLQWVQLMQARGLLMKDELPYILKGEDADIDLSDIVETILGILKHYISIVPSEFKPLFFGVFIPDNGNFQSPSEFFSNSSAGYSDVLPRSCTILAAERVGLTSYKDSLLHKEIILPNGVKSIQRHCDYTIKKDLTQITLISEFGIDNFTVDNESLQELPHLATASQYCNVDLFIPSVNADGDTDIQIDVPVSTDRHLTNVIVNGGWKSSETLHEKVADLIKLNDIRNYNDIFVSGNDNPHFFISGYLINKLSATTSDLIRIENPEYVSSIIENGTWNNRRGNLKEVTFSRRIACHPAILGYLSNLPVPTHSCTLQPINITLVGGRTSHLILVHFTRMLPHTISKKNDLIKQTLHYTTWFAPWSPAVEETVELAFSNKTDVTFRKIDEPYLIYDTDGLSDSIINDTNVTMLYSIGDDDYYHFQDYVDHGDVVNAISVLNSHATNVTADMSDYIAKVVWNDVPSTFTLKFSDSPLNLGVIRSIEPKASITGYASGLFSVSGFGSREHLRVHLGHELLSNNQYHPISYFNSNCDKLVGCYNGNTDLSSRFPKCDVYLNQKTTASSAVTERVLSQGFGNNQLAYAYDSAQVGLPCLTNVHAQYTIVDASEAETGYIPAGCDVGYLIPDPSEYEEWDSPLIDGDAKSYIGRSIKIRSFCDGIKLSNDDATVTIHRLNELPDDSEEDVNFNQRSCISSGLAWDRITNSGMSLTINGRSIDWSATGIINELIPRSHRGEGNYDIDKILRSIALIYNSIIKDAVIATKFDGAWEHILDEDTPNYFSDVQRLICVCSSDADVSYHPSRIELLKKSKLARVILRPHYVSGFLQDTEHYQQLRNYESPYMTRRSWSTNGSVVSIDPIITNDDSEPEKIFCRNDNNWNTIYVYAFRRISSNEVNELAPWPGVQMIPIMVDSDNEHQWYEFDLEDFYGMWDYVIFSDNNGHQTQDLNLGDPAHYVVEPNDQSSAVMTYCCASGAFYSSYSAINKTFINQRQRALHRWFDRLNVMDTVLEDSVNQLGEEIIAPSLYQTKVMLDSQNFNIMSKIFGQIGSVINMGLDKIADIKGEALDRLTDLTESIKETAKSIFSFANVLSLDDLHVLQSLFVNTHLYHKFNVIDLKEYICNSANIENSDASILVISDSTRKMFNLDLFSSDGSLIASGLQKMRSLIQRIRMASEIEDATISHDKLEEIANDFENFFLRPLDDSEEPISGTSWLSQMLPRSLVKSSESYNVFVQECLLMFLNPLQFISNILSSPISTLAGLIGGLKSVASSSSSAVRTKVENLITYLQSGEVDDKLVTFPIWGEVWQRAKRGEYTDRFPWLASACEPFARLNQTFDANGQANIIDSDDDICGVVHLTLDQLRMLQQLDPDDVLAKFVTYWSHDVNVSTLTKSAIQSMTQAIADIMDHQGSYLYDPANNAEFYDSDLASTLANFYLFPSSIQDAILDVIEGIKEQMSDDASGATASVGDYRSKVNDWLNTQVSPLPNSLLGDLDALGYKAFSNVIVGIGYAITRYESLLSSLKETATVACTGFYTGMIEDVVNDEESVIAQVFNLNNTNNDGGDSSTSEDESVANKISKIIQPLSEQLLDSINKLRDKFAPCIGSHHFDEILQQVISNIKTYIANLTSHLQSNSIYSGLSAGMSNFMSTLEMGKNNVLSAITSALQRIPQITTFFARRGFSIYDKNEVEFNGYQSLDGVYKALGIVGLSSCGVIGIMGWGINKALVKAYQLARDFVVATVYDSASITYRRSGFEAIDITCFTEEISSDAFSLKFPNLWAKILNYRVDYPAELTLSVQYLGMFIFFIVSGDGEKITISMTPKLYDVQLESRNDAVVFKAIYDSYVQNIDWLNHVNKIAFDNFSEELSAMRVYQKGGYATITYSEAAGTVSSSAFNVHFRKDLFDDVYNDAIHAPYRRSNETVDTFIAWALATAGVGGVIAMTGNVIPGAIIGAVGLAAAGVAYLVNDYVEKGKDTNDVSVVMSTALTDKNYGNAMITNTHIYTLLKSYPTSAAELLLEHLRYYDAKGLIHNGSGAQTESGYFITCGFMKGQPRLALHLRTDLEMVLLKALRYGLMISTGVGAVIMTGMATKGIRLNRKLDKKNAAAWALDQHDPKYASKQTAIQKSIRKTSSKIDKLQSSPVTTIDNATTIIKENQSSLLSQFSIPAVSAAILDRFGYNSAADVVRRADRTVAVENVTIDTATNVEQIMRDLSSDTDGSIATMISGIGLAVATTSLIGLLKKRLRDRLGREATDDELDFFLDSLLMPAPGSNL